MPFTLMAMFRGPENYAQDANITVDPDDECIICREPYEIKHTAAEGCHAIRLACGHIIGHKCFRDWINHHPDICPWYNHPLPFIPNAGNQLERTLEWICSTGWFALNEAFIVAVSADTIPANATLELRGDQLTIATAESILHAYALGTPLTTLVYVIAATIAQLFGMLMSFLLKLLTEPWLPFNLLWPLKRFSLVCLAGAVCHMVAFLSVAGAVLLLGLWKSRLRAKDV
jgi:hypothetical protein